ncbi:MAG: A24 family peptidase [Burkholderiaceae bacterium]|jgi:leader peptidase (prepilin peptidase)/N-methyltransferase|nr:A24 family peptidase [Burkholderiaceae bacterium]
MPPDVLWMQIACGGLLGFVVGSFLNVVVYRLPKMMEMQWLAECAELTGQQSAPEPERFNLWVPHSRCPGCGHAIRWFENIPVLSYVFLRGKCSACGAHISIRYPLVELGTGLLFAYCVWRWNWQWSALAWCGFSATLVALTLIDWDTTLLPDSLTLPLLWAGLIAAQLEWTGVGLPNALWGAVAGYMSLWLVYWAFKLATGKEGMGFGDFKLFAALGAWFGWQALVPIILIASVIGALVGLAMKARQSLREGGVVPFGPFLSLGGITAMVLGPQVILRAIL